MRRPAGEGGSGEFSAQWRDVYGRSAFFGALVRTLKLECVSKIPEYAISGVAPPFLRHKARLSAAKPSDLFLELTKNPLELADCPA